MDHPSLVELLDGSAPPVRAHLGSCEACRALAGLASEDSREQTLVPLSHYRELGVLAVGGMGRTQRAIDLRLGRVVALKEMKRPDGALRARFEREARLTARLQHPAIVSVYEAGRWIDPDGARDGDPFYAMELVEGRTLDAVIAAAATIEERVALLPSLLRIVEAVAYAQEQGIVHRDIKPQNILIGKFGEAVLIDWGLAKDLRAPAESEEPAAAELADEGSAALTEHGAGTAQYMSPQQARGEPARPGFDVYALGATLYETLAGQPPYGPGSTLAIRRRLALGPPAPLAEVAPEVPRELQTVVERAMARDEAARFAGAQELAGELRRFLSGQLLSSHDYSLSQLVRRWLRRPVVRVGLAAALLLVAVAGVLGERVLEERDQATAELARRLIDQGRGELERNSPLRALAFLSEARSRGDDSPALRYLIHAALRPVEALRATLAGHTDLINVAAFSHDGRRVVTAGADATARLWDASDGRPLATLTDHVGEVVSASFDAADARLLTGGADGFAKIWDARSGALLRTLRADGIVFDAVFAPEGGVAVSTLAGSLLLWDGDGPARPCRASETQRLIYLSTDGRQALALDGGGAALLALPSCAVVARSDDPLFRTGYNGVFAPGASGRLAISAGAEAALLEPDGAGGLRLRKLSGHAGLIESLAFSPDGEVLVSCGVDSTARAWDAKSGALLATFRGHTAQVRRAEVSGDGRMLLTAGGDNTARLWDLRSGEPLATLEGHRNLVSSARFSPDGRSVLTVGRDGAARLWDISAAVAVRALAPHAGKLRAAAVSPDSQSALTAGDDGRVLLHRLSGEGAPRILSSGGAAVRAAGFSRDGGRAFAVAADGSARVWELSTESPPVRLSAPAPLTAAALSPDGRLLAVGGAGGAAEIFSLASGAAKKLDGHTDELSGLAFSPDGALLASASADGSARLWRVESGAQTALLQGHEDAVRSVAFSADGSQLLTASSDGTARLWSVGADGAAALRLTLRHRGTVYSATLSGDGSRVLTAGADASLRLWDARSGALLRSIDTGGVPLTAAALSPEAALAVGSSDRETALWDLASGSRLGAVPVLRGSEGNAASFSPDGRSVLILAHDDGRALLWDISGDRRDAAGLAALVKARAPWQFADGALLSSGDPSPATAPPAEPAPICGDDCFDRGLAAELGRGEPLRDRLALERFAAGCARGDARACARRLALQPDQLLDVLADGEATWALYAVPTASTVVNAYYGVAVRGAQVHLARYQGGRARDVVLNAEPLPVTGHGALGRDGADVLAYFNLKRRSETYLCDGLLFRAHGLASDGPPEIHRTQLFTEWNAGFHPYFEGTALHHYSYDDRRLAVDGETLQPASFEVARDQQFRRRLAALGLAREPGSVWSEYVIPRAQAAWLLERVRAGAPPALPVAPAEAR